MYFLSYRTWIIIIIIVVVVSCPQSLVEGIDLLRDISPPLEDTNTIVQSDEFFDTSTAPTDHNTIEEYFIDVVDMLDIPSDIDVKIFVPVKSDEDILQDGRLLMLDLINEERINRGLSPVSMGNNTAAQDHAENMLETCTSSHWGADGFKPYMRYTLAGGYQYNAENVSGLNYCVGYEYATTTVDESIHDAMRGLMASQGHRDNILDPNHAFVNIGIAHDGRNVKVVQHFEYDSVRFNSLPEINNGIASFSAIILGASEFDDYSVGIYYDPQPYMLTLGQLSRTYCYDFGTPVANIRPSLSPGLEYIDIDQTHYMEKCQDPYDVPASLPAPASPESALLHHKEAQYKQTIKPYPVNWVDADQWTILEDRFDVEFNIRDLTREHGPGVYTFVIGGFIDDDEYVPLSMYSVFHNMPIP